MSRTPTPYHFPDCPRAGRCRCVERARRLLEGLEADGGHGLTAAQWGALLLALDPHEHAEPRALPLPSLVLTRQARVEVYRERAASGQRLYHQGDLWRTQPTDDSLQAGVQAEHEANGAPAVEQRLASRRGGEP